MAQTTALRALPQPIYGLPRPLRPGPTQFSSGGFGANAWIKPVPQILQTVSYYPAAASPTFSPTVSQPAAGSILIMGFSADTNSGGGYLHTVTQTNVNWRPLAMRRAAATSGVGAVFWIGHQTGTAGTSITTSYGGQWPGCCIWEVDSTCEGVVVRTVANSSGGATSLTLTEDSETYDSLLLFIIAGQNSGGAGPTSASGGSGWTNTFNGDFGASWARAVRGSANTHTITSSRSTSWAGLLMAIR